ncbi:MAG: hypothetical protein HUJ77_02665 [Clostridium sp.]|uniref:hypothetical protein n=1 Tax=Clostridium sp. TaxID=1506 RepID=UPI0025BFBB2D|nr:hypothetical protein [Clostridium sp.]MCF0147281.1 hypothetical protein [Clostridium sp.]
MNKLKNMLEKIKNNYMDDEEKRFCYDLLIVAFINAMFLIAYFKLFRIYFVMNDDTAMGGLMAGIQGMFPGYSVFVNFIPSYLISRLAMVWGNINWFGIYLLGTCYLSFTFIGVVIFNKMKLKIGSAIYIAIGACGFIPILRYFTFTTIAYVAILAGIVFIIQGYYSNIKSIKYSLYIFGTLMFINGSFIRYKCSYTGIVLFLGFIIMELIKERKTNIKKVMILGLVVFIACGFSFIFRAYSMNKYYKDIVWNEYIEFNKARSNLIDFGLPDYNLNKEIYDSVGWSENDYNIFNAYSFPEEEKFSTENLEKIYQYKKSMKNSIDFTGAIKSLIENIDKEITIQICILFIIIISIYNIYFSKNKIMSIFVAIFPFAMHMLFILINRAPYRGVYPHYFMAVVLLLLITNNYSKLDFDKKYVKVYDKLINCMVSIIIVTSISISINPLYKNYNNRKNISDNESLRQSIEIYHTLCNDKDNIYLTSMNYNGSLVREYSILRWNPQGSKENVISVGGWGSRSKNIKYVKELNGIDNLIYDLIKKDNYFFVDRGDHVGMYITYFKETYNLDVSFDIVNTMYTTNVYKVNIINNYDTNNIDNSEGTGNTDSVDVVDINL